MLVHGGVSNQPAKKEMLVRQRISESFEVVAETAEAELAIVLGGDGSILRASREPSSPRFRQSGCPRSVGVPCLGFSKRVGQAFGDVVAGNCRIVEHLMLEVLYYEKFAPRQSG